MLDLDQTCSCQLYQQLAAGAAESRATRSTSEWKRRPNVVRQLAEIDLELIVGVVDRTLALPRTLRDVRLTITIALMMMI